MVVIDLQSGHMGTLSCDVRETLITHCVTDFTYRSLNPTSPSKANHNVSLHDPLSRRGAQSVDRAATKVVGRMHAYERLKSERLKSVVSATITADNANDAALIATGLTRERVNAALSVQLTNCEHGVDVQDGTRSRPLQAKPCGCQMMMMM